MGIVWLWHSTESSVALPYADITALDLIHSGKLVLETVSVVATVDGIRLEPVLDDIMKQRGGVIRVGTEPGEQKAQVTKVTVTGVKPVPRS